MATVPSREVLLSLLNKQEEKFIHRIQERIQSRNWKISFRSQGVISDDGEIYINNDPALIKVMTQIVAEAAVEGALSCIDILSKSDTPAGSADELQILKKRVARLEGEIFNLLPPTFENPSSEEPMNN